MTTLQESEMTKIIALFNQSGGIGKTDLTMNLGYQLSQIKKRVLLVDMDPQGTLTDFMGLEPFELATTVYQSIMNEEALPIHPRIHDMDLVPANIDLSGAELELASADMREFRLKDALEKVQDRYDFILIDCPPSLGILSFISLVAATHTLIPIQSHYKGLKGTELLFRTIKRVRRRANKTLKIAGFVPTFHEASTGQGSRTLDAIQNQLPKVGTVYDAIPKAIAFADASEEHLPLALYQPKHPVVKTLKKIARSLAKL